MFQNNDSFDAFVTPILFDELRKKLAEQGKVYQPGWKIVATFANGEVAHLSDLTKLEAFQDRLGVRIYYGMRPEGYDSFVIAENGGGGSISLAYFFKDGVRSRKNLMVAAVYESRNGHPVVNLPRAFLKPGEQHLKVAETTAAEEFGLNKPFKTFPLFNPENANSAFFFNEEGQGCRFFAMQVNRRALQLIPENGHFKFKNEVVAVDAGNAATKRLLASVFMPAHQIIKNAAMDDLFTAGGIGLLKEALWPIK